MDTTINNSVQQLLQYKDQTATPRKTSEKAASQSELGTKPGETPVSDVDGSYEKGDTVEITHSRFLVSEANRAASETEIEDIDQAIERIQELKDWFEAEYESAQIEQVHQLNGQNLTGVLS